jgi:hypothetical protein
MKRAGQKAPAAIHGPLGITYHSNEKANMITNCLEDEFISHDLPDENHGRHVETKVQDLLVCRRHPLVKVRPYDVHKLLNTLKMRKVCGLGGTPRKFLVHLPRRPVKYLTHEFNHCLWLSHFPKSWMKAKVITLPKPGTDQKLKPD